MRKLRESLDNTIQSKAYTSLMATLPQDMQKTLEDGIKGFYSILENVGFTITTPSRRANVTKSVAKGGIYGYQNSNLSQLTWHENLSMPYTGNADWRTTLDNLSKSIADLATKLGGKPAGDMIFFDGYSLEITWKDRPHVDLNRNIYWSVMFKAVVPAVKIVAEKDKTEHNIEKHVKLMDSLKKALSKVTNKSAVNSAVNAVEDIYAIMDEADYVEATRANHRQKEVDIMGDNRKRTTVTADVYSWSLNMTTDDSYDYFKRFNFLDNDYEKVTIGGFYSESYKLTDDLYLNIDYKYGSRSEWSIRIAIMKLNDTNRFADIDNPYASENKLALENNHIYIYFDPSSNSLSGSERGSSMDWMNQWHYYTRSNGKTAKAWEGLLNMFDKDTTEHDIFRYLMDNFHIILESYLPD